VDDLGNVHMNDNISGREDNQPKVLFPLHGIRTRAAWQRSLADIAHQLGWVCRLDRWNFGHFSVVRFLLPRQRRAKVAWLNETYHTEINDKHVAVGENRYPSIIAHSFGSYILGNALLKYETLRFNKIILCGSILPKDFPWDVLLNRGQVQAVRNEYGVNDRWSRIVKWFVSGTGDSGVTGFSCQHPRFEQAHFPFFTHSEYFDRGHMRTVWGAFLNKALLFIEPQSSEPLNWASKPFRPLGLYALYFCILLLLTLGVAYLYPGTAAAARATTYLFTSQDPQLNETISGWIAVVVARQGESGGFTTGEAGTPEQAWTTAEAITAVTSFPSMAARYRINIRRAFTFIENTRRLTPEAGWGYFSADPHTITEIGAWVQVAYLRALKSGVVWNRDEVPQIVSRLQRNLDDICSRQTLSGGWSPVADNENAFARTYVTAIAVWALIEARELEVTQSVARQYDRNLHAGVEWLLTTYDSQLGWVPTPQRRVQKFDAINAQTFWVISRAAELPGFQWIMANTNYRAARDAILLDKEVMRRSVTSNDRLASGDQTISGVKFSASDQTPETFRLEGSTFLWFPWFLAAYSQIERDSRDAVDYTRRVVAQSRRRQLMGRVRELQSLLDREELFYRTETLLGLAIATNGVAD
jgi:hypothetical protein